MSAADPRSAMRRTFKNAIEFLNHRRRPVRPASKLAATLEGLPYMPGINGKSDMRGTPSITGMQGWLQKLGHSVDPTANDIDDLNVIHVAGTKGKGSTCAFVDSFLGAYSERTGLVQKRGLYTSPHLVTPEERIRINARPLDRELFTRYFFEVHDTLFSDGADSPEPQPRYLQLFFLLAIHTFIREGVDVAIIETHHGGEYDATNILHKPLITAITSLGLDHVSQLGPSIENIAWHKAGIFKTGSRAFSVNAEPHVAKVLQDRAREKAVDLTFVPLDMSLPCVARELEPDVQRLNCSLALAVARSFVAQKHSTRSEIDSEDVADGLRRFNWPGRFQEITKRGARWYLDGAHNEMSAAIAAQWFTGASSTGQSSCPQRNLIFGQVTEQRDPTSVVRSLAESTHSHHIQTAIFTLYDPSWDSDAPGLTSEASSSLASRPLQDLAATWSARHPRTKVLVARDISEAIALVERHASKECEVHTLITGSQHLVGAALLALKSDIESNAN